MKKFFLSFTLLFSFLSLATAKEKKTNSKIEHITVFLNGAQIQRSAEFTLTKGIHQIKLSDLAPSLEPNSIQVKGFGNFTILSVKHQFDTKDLQEEISQLQMEKDMLEDSLNWLSSEREVFTEEESLLQHNKKLGSEQNGVSIDQLQLAADFYRKRLSEIKKKKLHINREMAKINTQINALNKKTDEFRKEERKEISEVLVTLSAEQYSKSQLILEYYVPDAGWTPAYDVRVKNTDKPVTLNYKAKVYQNSSEDWNDVNLSLSTGNPDQSAHLPVISPSYLSFSGNSRSRIQYTYNPYIRKVRGKVTSAEEGFGLPGVNVNLKGRRQGSITDVNGNYSLDIPQGARTLVFSFVGMKTVELPVYSSTIHLAMEPDVKQLSEVVVTGYAVGSSSKYKRRSKSEKLENNVPGVSIAKAVNISVNEQATTTRFDIALPYTIPSNGEEQTVEIKKLEMNTAYEYYAAPSLDPSAFLTAKITGWEESHLLSGSTNLYLDGTFVGSSSLDFSAKSDTLTLSMGKDHNISVERKMAKNEKGTTFSGNNEEKFEWKIIVRNHKGSTLPFKLQERIPVSQHKSIDVDFDQPENTDFDEETGILTWNLSLKPHATTELSYDYEVSYPKNEQVYIQ